VRIPAGLVIAAVLLAPGGLVRAGEPVPIGEVVADPDAYHFRIVPLQGTVRKVAPLPPYTPGPDTTCYGAYTFTLEDDTGSIEISVLGICGKPILRKPEVNDGEVILLTAQILSPNHLTSAFKGEVKRLRAVANSITHPSPVVAPTESPAPDQPNQMEETAKPEGGGRPGEDNKPAGDSGY
jgi:hypothetical protein